MVTKVSVEKLADQLGIAGEVLLKHFKAANMRVSKLDQEISENQKNKIMTFLKNNDLLSQEVVPVTGMKKTVSSEEKKPDLDIVQKKKETTKSDTISLKDTLTRPNKVVLKRTTKSTLQVTGPQNRSPKTVNVEVRKKRTYMKRSLLEQEKIQEEQKSLEEEQFVQKEKQPPKSVEPIKEEKKTEPVISEQPKKKSIEETLGIDKDVVLANLEREKQYAKELEQEGLKTKKKKKGRLLEEAFDQKKIDLRKISLDEEGESQEIIERQRKKAPKSVESPAVKVKKQSFEKPVSPVVHEVIIPEMISVADLAQKMAVKAAEVVKVLMQLGVIATINQMIDSDTAAIVVETMGHRPKVVKEDLIEESLLEELDSDAEIISRAPVVTIMGHVDHGKTKLLDCIRRTKIAEGEAGGITQHIGAYHVKTDKGSITFLDTPGHEAFTAMRTRGVKVTDIVVLVVAADDGVMPQTVEAIQHAKAAEVPIVVAINKIDKPEADPDRVKSELAQQEIISEEWGGDVMFVNISAKQALGIDELLDIILLQSEMLELKAVKDAPARGVVIESRLDIKRGAVATVLVQRGTLRNGDVILAGSQVGRIRAMLNEKGQKVLEAGPSIPVEILGLSTTPSAGDEFMVVQNERKAREVALFRQGKLRDKELSQASPIKLSNIFEDVNKNKISVLNIVLKTDVQGSLEALREALLKLSTDEVQVKIISSGVGGITESDVNLAIASRAVIIGFNVRADLSARRLIETVGVDVHYCSIIYDVINEVKDALSGLLAPEIKEKILGLAEVRKIFRSSKFGTIAGCMVIDGVMKRNKPMRVLRDQVVIYEGMLDSLQRDKEDMSEVRQNMDCGIAIKNYGDFKEKDLIECFEQIKIERKL